MPFKPGPDEPDLTRLQISLLNAKIQAKQPALYQTISLLIGRTWDNIQALVSKTDASDTIITNIVDATFLTTANETALFPSSRQLLAGSGVTFNDAVAAQRKITVIDSFLLMGG